MQFIDRYVYDSCTVHLCPHFLGEIVGLYSKIRLRVLCRKMYMGFVHVFGGKLQDHLKPRQLLIDNSFY